MNLIIMVTFFKGLPRELMEAVDYVKPMTAGMVASLPMIILYILFERQIVAGIIQGAVKG